MPNMSVENGFMVLEENFVGTILRPEGSPFEVTESAGKKVLKTNIRLITSGETANHNVYSKESFKGGAVDGQGCPSGAESCYKPHFKHMIEEHDLSGPSLGLIKGAKYVELDGNKGAIEMDVDIMDPSAIEKVLDGRFNQTSAGIRTNRAICTVCKAEGKSDDEADQVKNWCEHIKGKSYDVGGKPTKCSYLFGDIWVREGSFTKNPAALDTGVQGTALVDAPGTMTTSVPEPEPKETVTDQTPKEDEKTLSAKKRDSLSSGTFCGPNRSFPVSDCAHVIAARRLIGRAKVSAEQKKKILSCVSTKAKKLGCESAQVCYGDIESAMRDIEETIPLVEAYEAQATESRTATDQKLEIAIDVVNSVLSTVPDSEDEKSAMSDVVAALEALKAERALENAPDELGDAKLRAESAEEVLESLKVDLEATKKSLVEKDAKILELESKIETVNSTNKTLASDLHKNLVERVVDKTISVGENRDSVALKFADMCGAELRELIQKQVAGEVVAPPPVQPVETTGEVVVESTTTQTTDLAEDVVGKVIKKVKSRKR